MQWQVPICVTSFIIENAAAAATDDNFEMQINLKKKLSLFGHLQPADSHGALDEAGRRRQRQEGPQRSHPRHLVLQSIWFKFKTRTSLI